MRFERWLYSIPLRIRSLLRRNAVERELDDELQYHLEQKTQQYAAAGMNAHSATLTALSFERKNAATPAALAVSKTSSRIFALPFALCARLPASR